ncbi:hypothetical protein BC936DRAFT_143748 [Jimgerdemannia flammicorona]|uniref:Carbohydrate esterase family 16 protein n=1 Tax=Jimgerdemannia flammicorona TaxID=994334 RepID=A0A433DDF9_9FUNG|nr:hypothetical protein BC936DRAFT_143748 [Jimgerdemannia flammicorona]
MLIFTNPHLLPTVLLCLFVTSSNFRSVDGSRDYVKVAKHSRRQIVVEPTVLSLITKRFNNIVVFGDSNCDNGNAYKLTNGKIPPNPPYSHSFTNGNVWDQYLVGFTGWDMGNYAYASATSNSTFAQGYVGPNRLPVPGIVQQVQDLYLPTLKGHGRYDRTLFMFWLQGNDFFDNHNTQPSAVVDNLINSIDILVRNGRSDNSTWNDCSCRNSIV